MKKRLFTLILGLFLLGISVPSYSDNTDGYTYSWITSCGVTVYRTFAFELTDAQCLFYMDMFEELYCARGEEFDDSDKQ